jgi:regulator of protease activity HflC (stomatin/prohibitin superfamily)
MKAWKALLGIVVMLWVIFATFKSYEEYQNGLAERIRRFQ